MNYKKIKIIDPKHSDDELSIDKDKLLTKKELIEDFNIEVRRSGNLMNLGYYVACYDTLKDYNFHLVLDNEGSLVLLPVKKRKD